MRENRQQHTTNGASSWSVSTPRGTMPWWQLTIAGTGALILSGTAGWGLSVYLYHEPPTHPSGDCSRPPSLVSSPSSINFQTTPDPLGASPRAAGSGAPGGGGGEDPKTIREMGFP